MDVIIPPIKCQGRKIKLVPFIKEHAVCPSGSLWIEPFVGSGAVAFNVKPERALLVDKNRYIISFYKGLQSGTIDEAVAGDFLRYHGAELSRYGAEYYLKMRKKFNMNGDPLYFLFLNRCGFNGLIRFNRKGELNVPFCNEPGRFTEGYISKVCAQIKAVSEILYGRDWTFLEGSWREGFRAAGKDDCIYLDPPYIGRDTTYVGGWPASEAVELSAYAHKTPANVLFSMWKKDRSKRNEHLYEYWSDFTWFDFNHFYYVSAKASGRQPVEEVLAVKFI